MNDEKRTTLTADDFLFSLAVQIAHQNNGVLRDVKIVTKTEEKESEKEVFAQ